MHSNMTSIFNPSISNGQIPPVDYGVKTLTSIFCVIPLALTSYFVIKESLYKWMISKKYFDHDHEKCYVLADWGPHCGYYQNCVYANIENICKGLGILGGLCFGKVGFEIGKRMSPMTSFTITIVTMICVSICDNLLELKNHKKLIGK